MSMPTALEDIFLAALEKKTAAQRAAWLDEACRGQPELRQQVERLLAVHPQVGDFLQSPPTAVANFADTARESAGEPPNLTFLSPSERPGSLGRLGHYEILEVVGSGGFGIVLKAYDEKLHRIVAIKALAPALAASATARKRFVREAQAAAAVNHDNVVHIYQVEEAGPAPYLVMEYVAGMSLEEKLKLDGPLEPKEALRIGLQTAEGLAAAHRQGLVHRDVKPANILLENGVQRVKITDFGLARTADDASITQTGVIAGTPSYMSPEQAEGQRIDLRSDLFSLGSVLFAMCTGRPPFAGQGTAAVLKKVCHDAPAPIRDLNPAVPAGLAAIIERLLAKSPAERYPSAESAGEALRSELAALQRGEEAFPPDLVLRTAPRRAEIRHRPRLWAAVAAWLVLVAGGVALSEVAGITNLAATVIRIFTPEGTLVVEVDDPQVQVTIEGDGGLSIAGAGTQEVRVRPGKYHVQATKDGKPVATKLVEITRGDRKVVTVTREVPAEAPAGIPRLLAPQPQLPQAATASSAVGQFVVLKGDGTSSILGAYPTLAEAVRKSSDGDTIEIRGNGPFPTDPIHLSTRRMIRAGQGFHPVITKTAALAAARPSFLLDTRGALILEGLEFQGDAESSGGEYVAVNSVDCPVYVANCRFARCELMIQRPPVCQVQNTQFSTVEFVPYVLFIRQTSRALFDNNIVATRSNMSPVTLSGGGSLQRIEVTRNTLLGGDCAITISSGLPPGEQKVAPPQLYCAQNIVSGRSGVLRFMVPDSLVESSPTAEQGGKFEDLLRQLVVWSEERNVYPEAVPLLALAHLRTMKRIAATRPYTTTAQWNQFWGLTDTTSIQGVARFQGGDLVYSKLETWSPDDFRLRPDSAGYRAGEDGKDLGADIDLVGPGEAYERWKQTPDYQQWLKETGQTK